VRSALLSACVIMIARSNLTAQVTFDGCVDFRGISVASVRNDAINDVAVAGNAPNGAPIIQYNTRVLASLQPQTRLFFYAHECAHHALAHSVRNVPFTQEQEADCWAVRTLTERGDLDDDDVSVVQSDISRAGQGDWTHLPGPQRAINLRRCLGQRDGSATGNDTCRYSRDGECDEPDTCQRGTDTTDCRASRSRPTREAASRCSTPYGACWLGTPLSVGDLCYCPSLYGPVYGRAVR